MEEKEKISVFGSAKLKTNAKLAKDKPVVTVTGLEGKLLEYTDINADLTDTEAQLGAVTDEIKNVSREKFTELYLANKENPHTFLIQAGDECVMVIPSDKYEKVDDEARADQLKEEYGKDVVTVTERFYFNPTVIERNGMAIRNLVDNLIINAKDISEDDKANLLTKEISYAITKGTVNSLVEYAASAKTDIATVVKDIRPIFQLKNCGEGGEMATGGDLITEIPLITGWSACHWAPMHGDGDTCPVCGEHTRILDDNELRDEMEGTEENEQRWEVKGYDDGGALNEELETLTAALDFVTGEDKEAIEARIKEIHDLEKKPKGKARTQAHMPDSHTPQEVEEVIAVEPIKKEVEPIVKGKGLFDTAKAKPAAKKTKGDKIIVSIPELKEQLAMRTILKADVDSLKEKMSAVAEEMKRIAIEKFVEIYQKSKKNPETFLIKDGKGCIMVLPVDNYIKIDADKASWLTNTYGSKIVTVTEFYYFDTEVLRRNQPAIETIIGDADISDEDKSDLLLKEVKYTVTKGLIDNMLQYGKKMSHILEDVKPTFMLKACGKMEKGGKFSRKGNLRDELILDVPVMMGYSNCCFAPVYGESDICSKCGEHCMVLSESEVRNELAEHSNEMANGGSAGEFDYRLLGRLCTDNDYFLGNGNRSEKSLWAGNVKDQISEMKKLWNKLPEKPEWLTMEDILEYEREMTKGEMASGGGVRWSGLGDELVNVVRKNSEKAVAKHNIDSAKSYCKRTGDDTLIAFAQRKYDEALAGDKLRTGGAVGLTQYTFKIPTAQIKTSREQLIQNLTGTVGGNQGDLKQNTVEFVGYENLQWADDEYYSVFKGSGVLVTGISGHPSPQQKSSILYEILSDVLLNNHGVRSVDVRYVTSGGKEWMSRDMFASGGAAAEPMVLKEFDVVDHENNIITTIAVGNIGLHEATEEAEKMIKQLYPENWKHYKLRYAGAQAQLFEIGGPADGSFAPGKREDWAAFMKNALLEGKSSFGGHEFTVLDGNDKVPPDSKDELSIIFKDGSGLTFGIHSKSAGKWTIKVTPWVEVGKGHEESSIAKKIMDEKFIPYFNSKEVQDIVKKDGGGKMNDDLKVKWDKEAQVLVGKTVRAAGFLTKKEATGLGWDYSDKFKSCLVIEFTDGSYLFASKDDEGNDAGFLDLACYRRPELTYDQLKRLLSGLSVEKAEYMALNESKHKGFSSRPLVIKFKNGDLEIVAIPLNDPAGNDGGAIFGKAGKKDLLLPTL